MRWSVTGGIAFPFIVYEVIKPFLCSFARSPIRIYWKPVTTPGSIKLVTVQIRFWVTFASFHRRTNHSSQIGSAIVSHRQRSKVRVTQSLSVGGDQMSQIDSKFKENFAAVSKFGAEHKFRGRRFSLNWAGASVCLIIISLLPLTPAPMIPSALSHHVTSSDHTDMGTSV